MLKEEFIWTQFQRFQSKVSWIHCFGPEARQNIMVAEKAAHFVMAKKQRECERKGPRTKYSWQGHTFSGLFPPTRSHFLVFHHFPINNAISLSGD
jgi:hypothetical protein